MEMTELINEQQTDKRETPWKFFKVLDEEFGFTLDPCATDETAKCDKYYTPKQDGLSKSWANERVFMNPPYSNVYDWMGKAHDETDAQLIVCLVFSRTSTKWWHEFSMEADEIRFVKRRIQFDGLGNNSPAPSALVIFEERHNHNPRLRSQGQP
jgi:phage N-6-adenine-methyltransferase